MSPLKSSSRFQLGLGAAIFGAVGAEAFGIAPANLDVPIGMFKGFLATATRGMPWLGGRDEEEEVAAADCIISVMIRMKSDWKRY